MLFISVVLLCTAIFTVNAAELTVDYSKKTAGAYPDFQSALKNAKDGDTVKILKVDFPIPDAIIIKNRSSLTVDGMFNTFSGVQKANPKNWQNVSKGLWKRDIRLQVGISRRYFMVINGKLNRMGRFFKAPCRTAYKKVDELKENEWTIVENPNSQIKRTKLFSVYLKLDSSVTDISKADIKEPVFSKINGVELSGKCKNLTFKNMICRNFWNDGYNIHNTCTNTIFDTVCAIDCGDDGISAHEDSQIKVNNFVSVGNSTGICHIQRVTASHSNCYIEGALGKDIYFKNEKSNLLKNSLKNVFIKTTSAGGVCLGTAPQDKISIDKLTVVLANPASRYYFTPAKGSDIEVKNITVTAAEPKNMADFRKAIFAKFQGEIEKNLSAR